LEPVELEGGRFVDRSWKWQFNLLATLMKAHKTLQLHYDDESHFCAGDAVKRVRVRVTTPNRLWV
jgi:hypothetical protein